MNLNAREPKEQNLPYGRKKKRSISRISDEPRMVVVLRSLACPRTQDSGNWAQKLGRRGVEDLKCQAKGPCLFS